MSKLELFIFRPPSFFLKSRIGESARRAQSPGAATVAPFARTRLKRPAGADATAWAAREAELVAWFEGGGE